MKISELFTGRVLTLSNVLSLLRILLVPFLWYLLSIEKSTGDEQYRWYSIGLLTIMILTDYFDGFFARLLDQVSRLGQFLDPVADKIAAQSAIILLIYYKDFPLWILLIMLLRDAFAIVGGLIIFSRRDIQVRPNSYGKLMVSSMGFSAYVYILSPNYNFMGITLQHVSIFLIILFTVLSTLAYWKTYSQIYFNRVAQKQ